MKYAGKTFTLYASQPVAIQGSDSLYTYQNTGTGTATIVGSNNAVNWTSVATVVGHFPLILASGAGASARNSIGIILVSGMLIGTVFTLFVVPLIYSLVASDRNKNQELYEAK